MSRATVKNGSKSSSTLRSAVLALSTVLAAGAVAPAATAQEQAAPPPPKWSVELKGGRFTPEVDNWATYYGDDDTSAFAATIGRKLWRQLEVGAELTYGSDRGQGDLPLNGTRGGEVLYEFAPIQAYVLLRGIFSERQWLVPFVGAGVGQLYYRQHVSNGDDSEGHTSYHVARAGVQLLLDRLSPNSAANLQSGYGIDNTYLLVDFQRSQAEVDATPWDLGGESWLVGLLFEY